MLGPYNCLTKLYWKLLCKCSKTRLLLQEKYRDAASELIIYTYVNMDPFQILGKMVMRGFLIFFITLLLLFGLSILTSPAPCLVHIHSQCKSEIWNLVFSSTQRPAAYKDGGYTHSVPHRLVFWDQSVKSTLTPLAQSVCVGVVEISFKLFCTIYNLLIADYTSANQAVFVRVEMQDLNSQIWRSFKSPGEKSTTKKSLKIFLLKTASLFSSCLCTLYSGWIRLRWATEKEKWNIHFQTGGMQIHVSNLSTFQHGIRYFLPWKSLSTGYFFSDGGNYAASRQQTCRTYYKDWAAAGKSQPNSLFQYTCQL